jgi:hypothetical protein
VDHWAIHSFFAENFVVASCKTTRITCISMHIIYIYDIYISYYMIDIYIYHIGLLWARKNAWFRAHMQAFSY